MKRFATLYSIGLAILLSISSSVTQAQEEMIYVPVNPCRIADTRASSEGVISGGTLRVFKVSGTAAELAVQGGQTDCEHPKQSSGIAPLAVSAYVVAVVPQSSAGNGALSAYPSDQEAPPPGSGSTVNFTGNSNIGNTTIAKVCSENCPDSGELTILARNSDRDVVIDVQGYFYADLDRGSCSTENLKGTWTTYVAESLTASEACTFNVSDTGAVTSGSCTGSAGAQDVTGGQLTIDADCGVGGSYSVEMQGRDIESASISSDRSTITGIITDTAGNLTRVFTANRR